jgi:DNA-binding response OmpR family regulator
MRVLVIEDEPRIVAFVRGALEAEGISVSAAYDGQTGLRAAIDERVDLVVLDLMLPGRHGLSVLAELRRVKPTLPVLILSARSELATKLRGFELGATDYIAKPFAVDELIARVRVHLRRSMDFDSVTINAGRLQLDVIRRQVRHDGGTHDLSDREFALLRCLATAAGEVVTRQQLLSDVWGYDFDPGTNVVDVCVRRLRQKLGASAPIRTVRNVGYSVPVT